jgi:hypothetical protein
MNIVIKKLSKGGIDLKFKEAYIVLVPEVDSRPFITVDPAKDRSVIDTEKYTCYTVLVQNQSQALHVCKKLAEQECVSILTFCPGFSDNHIAQVRDLLGANVGICNVHCDSNSGKIVSKLIEQAK